MRRLIICMLQQNHLVNQSNHDYLDDTKHGDSKCTWNIHLKIWGQEISRDAQASEGQGTEMNLKRIRELVGDPENTIINAECCLQLCDVDVSEKRAASFFRVKFKQRKHKTSRLTASPTLLRSLRWKQFRPSETSANFPHKTWHLQKIVISIVIAVET